MNYIYVLEIYLVCKLVIKKGLILFLGFDIVLDDILDLIMEVVDLREDVCLLKLIFFCNFVMGI